MNFTGIRHVHLLVAEHDRAVAFYTRAFGMAEVFRTGPLVLLGTPGGGDSLALDLAGTEEERTRAGQQGGVAHFGIHLAEPSAAAVDEAVRRAEQAGGRLVERGEHTPGALRLGRRPRRVRDRDLRARAGGPHAPGGPVTARQVVRAGAPSDSNSRSRWPARRSLTVT